jgi:hypothetical protein
MNAASFAVHLQLGSKLRRSLTPVIPVADRNGKEVTSAATAPTVTQPK